MAPGTEEKPKMTFLTRRKTGYRLTTDWRRLAGQRQCTSPCRYCGQSPFPWCQNYKKPSKCEKRLFQKSLICAKISREPRALALLHAAQHEEHGTLSCAWPTAQRHEQNGENKVESSKKDDAKDRAGRKRWWKHGTESRAWTIENIADGTPLSELTCDVRCSGTAIEENLVTVRRHLPFYVITNANPFFGKITVFFSSSSSVQLTQTRVQEELASFRHEWRPYIHCSHGVETPEAVTSRWKN